MTKKSLITFLLLCAGLTSLNADLMVIGTAGYDADGDSNIDWDEHYQLIWDDNNNGNSLVWFDYERVGSWNALMGWAPSLDGALELNINPGFQLIWTGNWRLPVGGSPPEEVRGITSSIVTSELGHLYYEELGLVDYPDDMGPSENHPMNDPDFLFDNFRPNQYWTSTEYGLGQVASDEFNANPQNYAWEFNSGYGKQLVNAKSFAGMGIAVRNAVVTTGPVPVPEPGTLGLLALGFVAALGLRKRMR